MARPKKTDNLTGITKSELVASKVPGLLSIDDLNSFKTVLRKEFGADAAVTDDDFVTEFIATGIDPLDYYLGGGIPVGRLTEVAGGYGTGKSSFGIHMLGRVQKLGGLAGLIDTEAGGAGDKFRFDTFGVDTERCIVSSEDRVEKVFGIIEKYANYLVKCNIKVPSLVVVDSVAGLTSAKELETSLDQAQYPVTPKMISGGIKRTKTICKESNLTVIFINQTRIKMGGTTNMFTGPEITTPGGDALKFQAITRLLMERGATILDGPDTKNPIGHMIRTKIIKCKTSASLNRTLPMAFYYDNREFYNPKIVYDIFKDSKYWGGDTWKTVILPNGEEKKFNSEATFFKLFEESEENRQHFLGLMKTIFNSKLNFNSDTNVVDDINTDTPEQELLLEGTE
jgi:recombination protein RecA